MECANYVWHLLYICFFFYLYCKLKTGFSILGFLDRTDPWYWIPLACHTYWPAPLHHTHVPIAKAHCTGYTHVNINENSYNTCNNTDLTTITILMSLIHTFMPLMFFSCWGWDKPPCCDFLSFRGHWVIGVKFMSLDRHCYHRYLWLVILQFLGPFFIVVS